MKHNKIIGFIHLLVEKLMMVVLIAIIVELKLKEYTDSCKVLITLIVLVQVFNFFYYLEQDNKVAFGLQIFQLADVYVLFQSGFEQYISKSKIQCFIQLPLFVALISIGCLLVDQILIFLILTYVGLFSINASILQTLIICSDTQITDIKFYLRFIREVVYSCINQVGYISLIFEGFEHRSFLSFFFIFNGLFLFGFIVIQRKKLFKSSFFDNNMIFIFCFYLICFEGGVDVRKIIGSYNIPFIKKYGYRQYENIFSIQLLQKLFFFLLFLLLEQIHILNDEEYTEELTYDIHKDFTLILAIVSSLLMIIISGIDFVSRTSKEKKFVEIHNLQELIKYNKICRKEKYLFKNIDCVALLINFDNITITKEASQEILKCLLYSFSYKEIQFLNFKCQRINLYNDLNEQTIILDELELQQITNIKEDIQNNIFLLDIKEIEIFEEINLKTMFETLKFLNKSNQFVFLKCNLNYPLLLAVHFYYIQILRYIIKFQFISFCKHMGESQLINNCQIFYDLYDDL